MSKFKRLLAGILTAVMTVSTVTVTAFAAEAPEENSDNVIWVNGKDIKADKKDPESFPTLYKSEATAEIVQKYSGGKWMVVVLKDGTAGDADAFAKLFNDKGKIDSAKVKEGKEYASAKIKDGVITVTAGKKAGDVDVWLYEYKNKKVVNTTEVKPVKYDYTVKIAPKAIKVQNSEKADLKDLKLTVGDAAAAYTVVGTAKNGTVSSDATYTVELKDPSKASVLKLTDVKEAGTFKLEAGTTTSTKGEKVAIVITNVQSGKKITFNVTVKAKAGSDAIKS